ncbi:MAG: hypothetical protein ACT4PT_02785 [Methanobacteriota archaeon]
MAASLLSFIVAVGVLALAGGMVLLTTFVSVPPETGEDEDLRVVAVQALDLLVTTPGTPATWETDPDGADRVGLRMIGAGNEADLGKFRALRKGGSAASAANGFVDHPELLSALGLSGYNASLRITPIYREDPSTEAFLRRYAVAYIGDLTWNNADVTAESAASVKESAALGVIKVRFENRSYDPVRSAVEIDDAGPTRGDKYVDSKNYLQDHFLFRLQNWSYRDGSNAGAAAWDLRNVTAAGQNGVSAASAPRVLTPSRPSGGAWSYNASRPAVGTAYVNVTTPRIDITNATSVALEFRHFASGATNVVSTLVPPVTTYTPWDYGVVLVCVEDPCKDATSWFAYPNPAAPKIYNASGTGASFATEGIDLTAALPPCTVGCNPLSLSVRFQWRIQAAPAAGSLVGGFQGWFVDDVKVQGAVGGAQRTLYENTNEPATGRYRGVVVGSDADYGQINDQTIADRLAEWVAAGGHLYILGAESQQVPSFLAKVGVTGLDTDDCGTSCTSIYAIPPAGTGANWLVAPYTLDWAGYNGLFSGKVYSGVNGTFDPVLYTFKNQDWKAVTYLSKEDVYGKGRIQLTGLFPYLFAAGESERLLVNSIFYNVDAHLFASLGPEPPRFTPVGSAQRTMLIERSATESLGPVELRLVLYVWKEGS